MKKITSVTLYNLVTDAFNRMQDLKISVVPVLEKNKLMGVGSIINCCSVTHDERPDILV